MNTPGSVPVLTAEDIVKSFGGVQALKGVDFALGEREIHGLVGENGAGKSTLVKILTGIVQPDRGTIQLGGRPVHFDHPSKAPALGIGAVFQELSLLPDLTVWENIFAGRELRGRLGMLDPSRMHRATQDLMERYEIEGIDPDTLVSDLSLAQRHLVEILKALARDPKILILDEATSALPQAETEHLFEIMRRLRDRGVSMIYISHRLEEITHLADRVTVFRDGENVASGNPQEMGQDEMIRLMIGHKLVDLYPPREPNRFEGDVLTVRGLGLGHRLHNVNLTVRKGEIFGIGGLAGQGQADLLFALYGVEPATTGDIALNGKPVKLRNPRDAIHHGIAFIPEDRKGEGVALPLSISDNVALPTLSDRDHLGIIDLGEERSAVRRVIQRLQVKAPSVAQRVGALSGGNQQKVVIAKWLLANPQLLLMNDPTRGIDVGSKREIYDLMRELTERGVAIVFVSSDLTELVGMSDRVGVMYEGTMLQTLETEEISGDRIISAAVGVENTVKAVADTSPVTGTGQ